MGAIRLELHLAAIRSRRIPCGLYWVFSGAFAISASGVCLAVIKTGPGALACIGVFGVVAYMTFAQCESRCLEQVGGPGAEAMCE